MDYQKEALRKHREWAGKIEIKTRAPLDTAEALALAYTPGVAAPCLEIEKNPDLSFTYTRRWNTVAVITNGTAILGLGDIGPVAGMPVMEGKAALFKAFGDVDAIPLCVNSKDVDEFVHIVAALQGSFGGVNLEDIKAPECFYIEEKLKKLCDIPIFHDDQHGTAVVTLAALINATKFVGKKIPDLKIVMNGAGAAAVAICKLLLSYGCRNITLLDRHGAIYAGRDNLNDVKKQMAEVTNLEHVAGDLQTVIKNADVFIGVSAPHVLTPEMVRTMNRDSIVFACANPIPEIMPDLALQAGAAVVATGRSDFPNQINNVLAFPGIFRGALDVRAKEINEAMKLKAAEALAALVTDAELKADYILPQAFDHRVTEKVAEACKQAAIDSGINRV